MERETKIIETLTGKKVEVKSYLTGRENNELKRVIFASINVDTDELAPGDKPKIGKIPLTAMILREEALINQSVVSFEGKKEGAIDAVLCLPSNEYEDIVKKIDVSLKLGFQKAM